MGATMTEHECPDCGGEIEAEIVGNYKDRVCQKCGFILGSQDIIENQEVAEYEDEYEVME